MPMMSSLDTATKKKNGRSEVPLGLRRFFLTAVQSLNATKSIKIRFLLRLLSQPCVRSLDVTIMGNVGFNSLTILHIVSNFINILRFKFTIKFFYSQSSQADKKILSMVKGKLTCSYLLLSFLL